MAQGDVWRLAWEGQLSSQQIVNVWHVRMKSGAGTPTGAIAHINTYFYSLYKTQCASPISWINVRGRKLVVPAAQYEEAISPALVGSVAADSLPATCAVVATLRTGFAGRSYRGRLYLAGLTEGYVSISTINTAQRNAIQTYFDDLVTGIGLGGSNPDYEWGVFSRLLGENRDPVTGAVVSYDLSKFFPINSVVVRNIIGTQRRRRPTA